MVVNRPSTIPPVDDDSILLSRHIHELLNDRSWAVDEYSAGASEDDELQKEIDMLPSAERRVSEEISDLVRLFSNQQESQIERQVPPRGTRKLHSTGSPMNQIYKQFATREDSFATINHATKRLENAKNARGTISNTNNVDTAMLTRDVRDSPGHSQPSDEKGNGIFGVSIREPPEEILFVEDDETNDASTDFSQSTSSESVELKFLQCIERLDKSAFVEHRDQEEEFFMLSDWCLESRQLSDLEKRENDLFTEESFWEQGFWKTPVNESAPQATSATVRREQLRKSEVSEIRKGPRVSQSKQDIIKALSMPVLDHKMDRNPDPKLEDDYESVESQRSEFDIESGEVSEKSDAQKNMTQYTEVRKSTPFQWKSALKFQNMNDYGLTSRTQTKVNHSVRLDIAVSNEREGVSTVYKDNHRGDTWNWRRVVLVVHVILNIIGGVVFILFLR